MSLRPAVIVKVLPEAVWVCAKDVDDRDAAHSVMHAGVQILTWYRHVGRWEMLWNRKEIERGMRPLSA